MGAVEKSPARRNREAAKRRRQEQRWASKSGPVTVRRIDEPQLHADEATD
jgi:hypothetical protein